LAKGVRSPADDVERRSVISKSMGNRSKERDKKEKRHQKRETGRGHGKREFPLLLWAI
jgi:hypothetical protein